MQRENENIVWVDVSHYVVLGSITKELSELFVKNTEFSGPTKTFESRPVWGPAACMFNRLSECLCCILKFQKHWCNFGPK